MNVVKVCGEYCIGCGLCHSELGVEMKPNEKGFLKPEFQCDKETDLFLKKVCPAVDRQEEVKCSVWGPYSEVYAAFANDKVVRKKASSGGVITALAIYMLENGYVDGIIHVRADVENPTKTVCCVSVTREDVEGSCGSRYAISSPWFSLSEMVESDKRYAAIGKPCDIKALRRIKEANDTYSNILYLLSFFCAGMPSKQANERLLRQLGCEEEECTELTYRGNGWPGYATAVDKNGHEYKMEYSEAWGGILGRDVHPYCRVCFDGIGEVADIACGDGWYISENQEPDFSEKDGRNVVFVRTDVGKEIYHAAVNAGVLISTEWEKLDDLKIIQKYQFTRRTTMKERLLAYKVFWKAVPIYNRKKVRGLSKQGERKKQIKILLGTAKRIVCNKI